MFSDEMRRWKFDQGRNDFSKDRSIIVITNNSLYVFRRKDLRFVDRFSLADLSSILIITENSSIFVLKF